MLTLEFLDFHSKSQKKQSLNQEMKGNKQHLFIILRNLTTE